MTIVVAAIKDGKGAMCADTLIVSDTKKIKSMNFSKIVKFPKFYIGYSGYLAIFPILKELALNETLLKRKYMGMKTQEDALIFSKNVYELLSESVRTDKKDVLEGTQLIILNKYGSIFLIDSYNTVEEREDFAATGSGEAYALGAMNVLYETEDVREVVKKAVVVACDYDTGCGLPLHLVEMNSKKVV
jgi:ATP-dependent protease HslVU (ClpYQ) peptidase subunit